MNSRPMLSRYDGGCGLAAELAAQGLLKSLQKLTCHGAGAGVELTAGNWPMGDPAVGIASRSAGCRFELMISLSQFVRLDVRPLLGRGEDPYAAIRRRVDTLPAGRGLIVIAPFLPSPLIEKLGSEGFLSRFERGRRGEWIVYFWRDAGGSLAQP